MPIVSGGGQEFNLRSGTENVPYIVGLAKAVELVFKNRERTAAKMLKLRNKLLNNIIKNNKSARLNGSFDPPTSLGTSSRLPNNINIRFPGVSNETLLVSLDQSGMAISAGSACSARAFGASHVLTAIGLTEKQAKESIRITIGRNTTEAEIKETSEVIGKTIKKLKSI